METDSASTPQLVPPQLDFTHDEGIDIAFVENSFLEDHFPIGFTPSTSDQIKFFIRGTEHWIDFSQSFFHVKGEIVGTSDVYAAGTSGPKKAGKADDDFFLEQNFWHSIFSSINVVVNDATITTSNVNYPYAAFFQNLLNFSSEQENTVGSLCYWGKTKAKRKTYMNTDTNISGVVQLKCPLFMKMKNLLPFLNVSVELNRVSKPEFFFRWGASASGYSFKVNQIVFRIRKVKVTDSWTEFYEQMMLNGRLISYNFKDFRIFTRTYAGFGSDLIEDNLFHGIKPEFLILGFVDNEAFSGHKDKDPFKFDHLANDIKEIGLFVNGQPYPNPMIKMDFETKETFEAYYFLMASLGAMNVPDPPVLTKADFDAGNTTLFAFNLSPDQYSGPNPKELYNQPANIRLHVKFAKGSATKNITLVIYYEVNTVMKVNKTRSVMFIDAK
jgi:hypothetical protein